MSEVLLPLEDYRRVLDDGEELTFGKYRGLSVAEITIRDPGYVLWMDRTHDLQVQPSGEAVELARTLRSNKEERQRSNSRPHRWDKWFSDGGLVYDPTDYLRAEDFDDEIPF